MKKVLVFVLSAMLALSGIPMASAQSYVGTAQGFGGEIAVTLEIENGAIQNVTVSGEKETEGIGTRAMEYLPGAMVEGNTVEVACVSGATVTSQAILSAAADALKQSGAELKAVEKASGSMIPGVYTGASMGFHDLVEVEVEVTETEIKSVKVVKHNDTVNVGTLAIPVLEKSIVENQSLADVVSGVTFTSNAINGAVAQALQAAGASASQIQTFMNASLPVKENPGNTETDIVVVGAGVAGMVAALNAHDQGAKVILLEKEDITGGSARLSASCIWAVDFDLTSEVYDFTTDEIYEFINRKSGPVHNKEVFYKVTDNTGNAMNYLFKDNMEDLVVRVSNPKEIPQVSALMHTGRGGGFATMLDERVRARNIDLRLASSAVDLLVNEDGAVSGVVVEDESGRYEIKAKKVILATGGYNYDEEMMVKYAAGRDKHNLDWSAIGATGDGHKMGLKQGGYLVGEGTLNLAGVADRLDAFSFSVRTPILMDKNGKQMAAMDEHYSTICEKVTMCDEGRGYVVYDSGVERYIADLERLTADGDAFKADTLEELAAKMGIDVDNFMVTIETHNKHYHEQTNDEWGTEASTLVPIEKGPFYGFKYASYVMGTIAGLAVNTDLQIVREDGSAVENLYAIGELMYGNMFNTLYPMSGTALTICISGGQIAATHAVETMIQK